MRDPTLEELQKEIEELQKLLPTAEEMAYLRERKAADDSAAWMWKTIKTHAPWVFPLASGIVGGLYWVLTHTISVAPKP